MLPSSKEESLGRCCLMENWPGMGIGISLIGVLHVRYSVVPQLRFEWLGPGKI